MFSFTVIRRSEMFRRGVSICSTCVSIVEFLSFEAFTVITVLGGSRRFAIIVCSISVSKAA